MDIVTFDPWRVGCVDLADRPDLPVVAVSAPCAPETSSPRRGRPAGSPTGQSKTARIRDLLAKGMTPHRVATAVGCARELVYVVKARDKKRAAKTTIETAPSGAPATVEHRSRNAGAAAATCEATGQPHQGSDDVSPLREVDRLGLAPRPSAKVFGQSDRPISPPAHAVEPPGRPSTVTHLHRPLPAPRTCQWIEGQPTADDSCKCGKSSVTGHAYCARHMLRAYRVLPRGVVA